MKKLAERNFCQLPILTHFMSLVSFYTPWKHQKTSSEQKEAPGVSCKKAILKNSGNFRGKKPVLESLVNKVAGLQACNSIKRRLQHSCFAVKFPKCLRTPIWRTPANGCFSVKLFQFFFNFGKTFILLINDIWS